MGIVALAGMLALALMLAPSRVVADKLPTGILSLLAVAAGWSKTGDQGLARAVSTARGKTAHA